MSSALVFDDGVEAYDDLEAARNARGTTWVRADLDGDLDRVSSVFGIHPLSIEDLEQQGRPKTEEYRNYTFVFIKTATLQAGETAFDEEIRTHPVGLFVGHDWLVTVSPAGTRGVDRVWETAAAGRRVDSIAPDVLAARVLGFVVDDYFGLLDDIEDHIETIEEGILEAPDVEVLDALNLVRRDLLSVRKLLWPTREAVGVLARGDADHIGQPSEKYYRDAYDHVVELVDLTETYRELAVGARDIYLNTLSHSTNEVMKTLTVVATIILPLSFVASLYGMNFRDSAFNMPELGWAFGYPAVLLGLACVVVILSAHFRRRAWL